MKLPIPSLFGKKEKKEYFLALLLRDEKVTAVIFEEINGKIHVVGHHQAYFSDSIETASVDELLDVLDKAISTADGSLVKETETQKTIFGVKENWVEDAKLKKDYLGKLKKASDALGLLPIGFLIIHEAVAHLMQTEEGAPVSAVLVEIGKKTAAISLLRAGRIVETKRTEKGDQDFAAVTDNILHHFTNYEVLPSRIVIVGDTEGKEKLSQEFINHTWSKSLPFLHLPQITIQPKEFEAKAILSGAASQMGFDLLHKETNIEKGVEKKEDIQINNDNNKEEAEEEIISSDFGFVKDKDIAIKYSSEKKEEYKPEEEMESNQKEETIVNDNISFKDLPSTDDKKNIFSSLLIMPGIIFKKIPFSNFNMHGLNIPYVNGKTKIIGLLGIFAVFIALLLIFYIFFFKATIVLLVKPKIVDKKQAITFASKDNTNIEENIIAIDTTSVTEDGTVSESATGKKEIGTNAKGSVTIYSRYTSEKTFPQGTILEGPNNLNFVFDKSVTIASGSADASADPVKVNVAVTAKNIGKESNLPSGSKFTISDVDSSLAVAKNDSAFSGGTKTEVTVIAKADLDKAITDLTKNLNDKASSDLVEKLDKNTELIDTIVNTSVAKKSFDKNAGEEGSLVKLAGSISYSAFFYQKKDILDLAKKLLEDKKNNMFSQDDVSYKITDIKQKDGKISATIEISSSLLPKLDNEKVAKEITGKSFDNAKNILGKIEQVLDVEIKGSPSIFNFPPFMPLQAKNITFEIKKQ